MRASAHNDSAMRRLRSASRAVVTSLGAAYLVAACVSENATAVDGSKCDGGCSGGQTSSGGAPAGGRAATGGRTGSSGGAASGGIDSEGSGGDGGSPGSGGDVGNGGSPALDAGESGGASNPGFALFVDAPVSGATVSGVVTVRGRAPGYLNVEVWDSTHQMPPLVQATPGANGAFSMKVDTTQLSPGPTTWTVWAWDSPMGQPFQHSENVMLDLTISTGSSAIDSGAPPTGSQTIGTGDIGKPAGGPAPVDASKVGGAPFVLVKNWDFGSDATITDTAALVSEFQFHDQFGTIANGTNYGAVIVAPSSATAITANNLGLPNNMQPVEDPAHPTREFTASSMKAHVRPLSPSQSTCTVSSHNAGNGSIVAKWKLPNGGALLGKDILWETRVRMPTPLAAYWFALWTAGNQWNKGAEMDVLESFGTPNIYPPPTAFHVDSVGGKDNIDYSSWPNGLDAAGVPANGRDLTQYHVWTWLYSKDDSYKVYYDGVVVQTGSIHWTLGGGSGGQSIDMDFLFDFGWGHTQISDVNISLPASSFPLTYEIDYSRVYLR
jgi:hypothetical protein